MEKNMEATDSGNQSPSNASPSSQPPSQSDFRKSSFAAPKTQPNEIIQSLTQNFECFVEQLRPNASMPPTPCNQKAVPRSGPLLKPNMASPTLSNQQSSSVLSFSSSQPSIQLEIPTPQEFTDLIARKNPAELTDIAVELYAMMQRLYFTHVPQQIVPPKRGGMSGNQPIIPSYAALSTKKDTVAPFDGEVFGSMLPIPNMNLVAHGGNLASPSYSRSGSIASRSTENIVTTKEGTKQEDDFGFDTIANYMILQNLGQGRYGQVFLAADEHDHRFAIKAVKKNDHLSKMIRRGSTDSTASGGSGGSADDEKQQQETSMVMREIAIMKKLRHKNIVQLYEVIFDEDEDLVYLVMQYIDAGTIASVGHDGRIVGTKPSEELVRKYIRQIATGLEYLHRHHVIHRDIKHDNILVDSKGTAYLADFGVSEVLSSGGNKIGEVQAGTVPFFSPELCNAEDVSVAQNYGKQSDVWALGVTMYLLLFGKLPFTGPTLPAIMNGIINKPLEFPEGTSEETKEVMNGLLCKNPDARMTLNKLRKHPYFLDPTQTPQDSMNDMSFSDASVNVTSADMMHAVKRKSVMLVPAQRRHMSLAQTESVKDFMGKLHKRNPSLVPTSALISPPTSGSKLTSSASEGSVSKHEESGGHKSVSFRPAPTTTTTTTSGPTTAILHAPRKESVVGAHGNKEKDGSGSPAAGSAFSAARFKRGTSVRFAPDPNSKRSSSSSNHGDALDSTSPVSKPRTSVGSDDVVVDQHRKSSAMELLMLADVYKPRHQDTHTNPPPTGTSILHVVQQGAHSSLENSAHSTPGIQSLQNTSSNSKGLATASVSSLSVSSARSPPAHDVTPKPSELRLSVSDMNSPVGSGTLLCAEGSYLLSHSPNASDAPTRKPSTDTNTSSSEALTNSGNNNRNSLSSRMDSITEAPCIG